MKNNKQSLNLEQVKDHKLNNANNAMLKDKRSQVKYFWETIPKLHSRMRKFNIWGTLTKSSSRF